MVSLVSSHVRLLRNQPGEPDPDHLHVESDPSQQPVDWERAAAADFQVMGDPHPLAGFQLTPELLLVAVGVIVGLLLEGWLYVIAYYGFFHLPTEGLDIGLAEVLTQGAHTLLFSLVAIPAAFYLRPYARTSFAVSLVAMVGLALCLALVAWLARWYSNNDVIVQTAAVIWVGMTALAMLTKVRRGTWKARFLMAAALLPALLIPYGMGTLDARQRLTSPHLVLVSGHDLGLPGGIQQGTRTEYGGYVLIRETPTRFWLLRADRPTEIYSISKSDVTARY